MPESATACNCTACRRNGVLWAYDYEGEGQSAEAFEFGMFDSANEYVGGAGIIIDGTPFAAAVHALVPSVDT
jgi:hypothetical protein